jgi:hypothetical protein
MLLRKPIELFDKALLNRGEFFYRMINGSGKCIIGSGFFIGLYSQLKRIVQGMRNSIARKKHTGLSLQRTKQRRIRLDAWLREGHLKSLLTYKVNFPKYDLPFGHETQLYLVFDYQAL